MLEIALRVDNNGPRFMGQMVLNANDVKTKSDPNVFRIVNWNIQHPSLERASKQYGFISKITPDCVLLTEISQSKATDYYVKWLNSDGFVTVFENIPPNDYGVLLAAKADETIKVENFCNYLRHRIAFVTCKKGPIQFRIGGVYAPSRQLNRGVSEIPPGQEERRKLFLDQMERL